MKKNFLAVVAVALAASQVAAPMANAGGLGGLDVLGGAIGGAIGAQKGGAGGAVAGVIIGVAMSEILKKLTEEEQAKRHAALQKAAHSGKASWSTKGKSGKKATYKKVGEVKVVGGQQCQKVKETITLDNGQQAVSEENVCFAG